MSHTKGPWVIEWMPFMGEYDSEGERNPDVAFIGPPEDDQAVAIAFPPEGEDPYDSPTLKANAALIATAPELLEVCEAALRDLEIQTVAVTTSEAALRDKLRSVIAKAKGEL